VVLNAKDGSLAVAAGARLAEANPAPGAAALRVAVFVLVASATVIVPVAIDLGLGARAAPILRRWHDRLQRRGSTAVIATLAIVSAVLVVQGARGL
jgi:predicted PurR-regulated permease PerM